LENLRRRDLFGDPGIREDNIKMVLEKLKCECMDD
jgi:hypothetical protein